MILHIFQIWDPFTGDVVQQLESTKYSPVIALATLPSPSTVVVTATTDSTLRYSDKLVSHSLFVPFQFLMMVMIIICLVVLYLFKQYLIISGGWEDE